MHSYIAVISTRVGKSERSSLAELSFDTQTYRRHVGELSAFDQGCTRTGEIHAGLSFGIAEKVVPGKIALQSNFGSTEAERHTGSNTERAHLQVLIFWIRYESHAADRFGITV